MTHNMTTYYNSVVNGVEMDNFVNGVEMDSFVNGFKIHLHNRNYHHRN